VRECWRTARSRELEFPVTRDGYLRDQLSVVGREAVRSGLVVGSGGNLSARRPGAGKIWVTGAGTWLDRLDESSFARVRLDATTTGAGRCPPTSELALHLATYRVRPEVNAIVHLHPQYAVMLDALGERIRLVTTDHAAYLGRIARVPLHPPGTAELAEAAAAAVADGANCVILAHHGCSVLGETVQMAHRRAANLEEAARLTYRALVLTGSLRGREIDECPLDGSAFGTV
jgi:ribulose-5-phosphate 4-epimerase/fuculose-1-phosphate aldolase